MTTFSDEPLFLDFSPPSAGTVLDGSLFGQETRFTYFDDRVAANWDGFIDYQSGIGVYRKSFLCPPVMCF